MTTVPIPADDLDAVLVVLRGHAVALACCAPTPPDHVRVEATGAVVELGWGSAPAGPERAPARPAAPTASPARPAPAGAPDPGSNGASVPAPAAHRVTAQTVGTFHRAPEPGAAPYVSEGDVVTPGQQMGIVEAMKLMIPVEADRGGRVAGVLCADGEPVEYGQALFALDAP